MKQLRSLLAVAVAAAAGVAAYAATSSPQWVSEPVALTYEVIESVSGEPPMVIHEAVVEETMPDATVLPTAELVARYGVDVATAGAAPGNGTLFITDVSEFPFVTYHVIEPGWS
jgi:hypothetical protein